MNIKKVIVEMDWIHVAYVAIVFAMVMSAVQAFFTKDEDELKMLMRVTARGDSLMFAISYTMGFEAGDMLLVYDDDMAVSDVNGNHIDISAIHPGDTVYVSLGEIMEVGSMEYYPLYSVVQVKEAPTPDLPTADHSNMEV